MNNIPDEIINKVTLYIEHPIAKLIKKEINNTETFFNTLSNIMKINLTERSFYFKWFRFHAYQKMLRIYYKTVLNDFYDF